MILYGYTAYLTLISVDNFNIKQTGQSFVAAYMLIFGFILVIFEVSQITPCEWFNNWVKRGFGFLFGPIGKSCYLVFIGIMSFGLTKTTSDNFPLVAGIVIIAWGIVQAILAFSLPDLFDKKEKYDPRKEKY